MVKRNKVSEEMKNEILFETGNRCAVCGITKPLEIAHIIPYSKVKEHKKDNLICLCCNCHTLADTGELNLKTLKKYKKYPWIKRNYNSKSVMCVTDTIVNYFKVKLQVTLEKEKKDFTEKDKRLLQFGIAGFLDIKPEEVIIERISEGSTIVKITLILNEKDKEKTKDKKELLSLLEPLDILDVKVVSINDLPMDKTIFKKKEKKKKEYKKKNQSYKKDSAIKLYLNKDWYLSVDCNGFYKGVYYESDGTYILQLRNIHNKQLRAIKIPKLNSDSAFENLYYNQKVEAEKQIVLTTGIMSPGLAFYDTNLLNIFRNIVFFPGNEQDKQVIGIQFEKKMPPRFCGFKIVEKGLLQTYPLTIKGLNYFTSTLLTEIIELGKSGKSKWNRTIVFQNRNKNHIAFDCNSKGEFIPYFIDKVINIDNNETCWYFGVPSVSSQWYSGTLEDFIKSNKDMDWYLEEYFSLLNNILLGLSSLHNTGFIHGDLRPANIMYTEDPKNPRDYHLVNYGNNRVLNHPFFLNRINREKNIIINRSIDRERNSPFYTPERRLTIENDDVNIGIFIKGEDNTLFIYLGWWEECIENDIVKSELIESIKNCKIEDHIDYITDNLAKYMQDELQRGDRIQIGDLIFNVIGVGVLHGTVVYKCELEHWKIYKFPIVLRDEDTFFINGSVRFFPVSKYIRIKQFSVSTDLYSIGALFLYLIYYGKNKNQENYKEFLDPEFHQLLIELESVQFFQTTWIDLATLCLNFNKIKLSQDGVEDIKKKMIDLNIDKINLNFSIKNRKSINLIKHSKDIARLIVNTIEGTKRLYENLDHNYVHFIYCIHFILCCLHKRIEIPENILEYFLNKSDIYSFLFDEEPAETKKEIYDKYKELFNVLPFTSNRTTPPRHDVLSPTKLCLQFLNNFMKYVNAKTFDAFIHDFNVINNVEISLTPLILKAKNQYLEDKMQVVIEKVGEIKDKCGLGNRKIKKGLEEILKLINE